MLDAKGDSEAEVSQQLQAMSMLRIIVSQREASIDREMVAKIAK